MYVTVHVKRKYKSAKLILVVGMDGTKGNIIIAKLHL